MSLAMEETAPDDEDYVIFRVPIDEATVAWLLEIAEERGCEPRFIASAILRDVREDDQAAHTKQQLN